MSIKINDFMAVETGGSLIATATHAGDDSRNAGGRPAQFSTERVITALILGDRLAAGYGDDDPLVIGWRKELR